MRTSLLTVTQCVREVTGKTWLPTPKDWWGRKDKPALGDTYFPPSFIETLHIALCKFKVYK